jgi:antibiotic biosynthesis monooxygenase (ABM) superfamily enzyme
MIARVWRGWTAAHDADAYAEYLLETGMRAARATPGNVGASILRRVDGGRAEFVTVILFQTLDAVRGFAGPEIERAVFFPEDERFLVEREETVTHYEVFDPDVPGASP